MKKDFNENTIKRYEELLERSRRQGIYTYTPFHSTLGASLAFKVAQEEELKLFGGMDNCERVVIRFGCEKNMGYTEDFPISLLHIIPKSEKYAEKLEHRDYLGALMNLGIERDRIGDIIINEKDAFIFVLEDIADFLARSLDTIRHTSVKCEIIYEIPKDILKEEKEEEYSLTSVRIDALLSKIYKISREDTKNLVAKEAVFVNGRPLSKPEYEPKEGEIIIARTLGRFTYLGKQRENKKGKNVILIKR